MSVCRLHRLLKADSVSRHENSDGLDRVATPRFQSASAYPYDDSNRFLVVSVATSTAPLDYD